MSAWCQFFTQHCEWIYFFPQIKYTYIISYKKLQSICTAHTTKIFRFVYVICQAVINVFLPRYLYKNKLRFFLSQIHICISILVPTLAKYNISNINMYTRHNHYVFAQFCANGILPSNQISSKTYPYISHPYLHQTLIFPVHTHTLIHIHAHITINCIASRTMLAVYIFRFSYRCNVSVESTRHASIQSGE